MYILYLYTALIESISIIKFFSMNTYQMIAIDYVMILFLQFSVHLDFLQKKKKMLQIIPLVLECCI